MRKSRCCLPPWQPGPVDCLRLEDRSRCDTTSNRARGKDQAGNSPHELPMEGQASYRSVVVDGKVNLDAAWLYPTPLAAAGHIQGRVAFWRGVTIEDSERAPRRTLRDLLRHAKSSPRVADSGHVSPVVDLDTAGFAASTSGQADKRTSDDHRLLGTVVCAVQSIPSELRRSGCRTRLRRAVVRTGERRHQPRPRCQAEHHEHPNGRRVRHSRPRGRPTDRRAGPSPPRSAHQPRPSGTQGRGVTLRIGDLVPTSSSSTTTATDGRSLSNGGSPSC